MKKIIQDTFEKKFTAELARELSISNVHAAPRIEKVVVNVGVGRTSQQPSFKDKLLPEIQKELAAITGQKPSGRSAKKSIAGFKLREGQLVGLSVTLRGSRMYDFIRKVTSSVYPRVRDFRGINLKNIDKQGNLNLGFREHVVFPEVVPEASAVSFGLQVTLVGRNIKNQAQALALYKKIGFRFKESEKTTKRKS